MLLAPNNKIVTSALKGISDNTAPGIDGYGAKFFKSTWDIIKKDTLNAIREFFEKERMFKAINNTLVTLIPKTPNASMIKDYRPISCCTTLYKIISKVMAARLSKVLGSIIDESQTAFVPGKHIQDHILLAYDTVEWCALEAILKELSFPDKFIRWIMLTVSTGSYTFKVNGGTTGNLKAMRDLRQGEPLSPLLFVNVMEYLHRSMQRLKLDPNFNFHTKCEKLNLINMNFADDLFLFARGDTMYIELLMQAFKGFTSSTGLSVNPNKCEVYFGNVENSIKHNIHQLTEFSEGLALQVFRYPSH